MIALTVLLAAVSVAFPREGQHLPAVSHCYVLGAADVGTENVLVKGTSVPVYRTGAWATLVPVRPGVNVIPVGSTSVTVVVAQGRSASAARQAKPPDGTVVESGQKTYTKLEYAADHPKPPPTGRAPNEITIVLDPGHGGADTGAVSPRGGFEKNANLAMARAVRQELENFGYKVVMTRDDDSFPALYDRPKVAHRVNADAFVSIHHNAPPCDRNPYDFRYTAVYSWNPIGEALARAINARMAATEPTLRNNGTPHANFAVTRNPEIPSCLIEVDFITTPEAEEACWNPARRVRMALAIASGIDDWCRAAPKKASP